MAVVERDPPFTLTIDVEFDPTCTCNLTHSAWPQCACQAYCNGTDGSECNGSG